MNASVFKKAVMVSCISLSITIAGCDKVSSMLGQDGTQAEVPDSKPMAEQKRDIASKAETATKPKAESSTQMKATQKGSNANTVSTADAAKKLGLARDEKLFATFVTSMGSIVAELYWEKAPMTVLNFVGLAEGTKKWTDRKTKKEMDTPLYSNTKFHRVIPGFMIQGGDPEGTGRGGPGFTFKDEFDESLRHDGPGILSMANRGPNTNGSQFFITEKATPHLNNRHTVFGKVVDNLDLVTTIANVEKTRPGGSTPKVDILLKEVKIGRKAIQR